MSTKGLDSFLWGSMGVLRFFLFSFVMDARKTSVICFSFFLGLGLRAWQTTRNLCKFTYVNHVDMFYFGSLLRVCVLLR